MKKKYTFWVLAAVLVALMVGAVVLYSNLSGAYMPENLATVATTAPTQAATIPAQTEPSKDEPAETEPVHLPDFTVYTQAGEPVKLSDFRGKPVVLSFWASWCGACKSGMPDLQLLYEKYKDDAAFMVINLTDGYSETVESGSEFMDTAGFTFPVYYDTQIQAATEFSVYSIPVTFFIDEAGQVQAYGQGAMDMQTLEKGMAYICP